MKLFKILGIALSASCCGISFLINAAQSNFSSANADSLNKIETTCWSYIGGSESYGHLIIHLTDNDFTSGSSTSYNYGSYGSKLEQLNFRDYVLINNERLNWFSYNEDGFKFSSEIYTNMFAPTDGTFSIGVNVASGHSISEITSIKILKGIQIPSKGYLEGNSNNVYTVYDNAESIPTNCNYGWATYADVKVWNIATVDNTYLGLKLSYSDLPTAFKDGTVGDSRCNYQTSVIVNDGSLEMSTSYYGLFNYQSINDCIWLQTKTNSSNATKVVVSKGTTFRMYHAYSTSPSWPIYFKVKETHTFTKDSGNHWIPFFDEIETSIETLSQNIINNEWPAFKLSTADYNTAKQAEFGVYFGEQFNLWNNIEVTDSSGTIHKAKDVFVNYAAIFCFGGNKENTLGLNSKTGYKVAGDLTKIYIPSGTEFPSFAYLNNPSTVSPKCYVTKENQTFVYSSGGLWIEYAETNVTELDWNQAGYLSFKLSNCDYKVENYQGTFETTYSNFTTVINIKNIGLSFDSSNSSIWNYGDFGSGFENAIAPLCNGFIGVGSVIIPAGTKFPSLNLSKGSTSNPLVYVTTSTVIFYFNGIEFKDASSGWKINNEVVSMGTHGSSTPGSNDVSLDFYTQKYDWPSTITDIDCRNTKCDPYFATNYNTFSKIHVYDASGNELTKTSELFINVWGKTGLYSIRLYQAGTLMSSVSTILIEKGCEFPTYAGLYHDDEIGKISDYSRYVTTKNIKFSFDYATKTFTEISSYVSIPTSVTAVKEYNQTELNSFLSFSLSNSDYGNKSMQDLTKLNLNKLNNLNFDNFITVNGVRISEMPCHNDYEMFMNLFSNFGSFSFRTEGNNTGCYYIYDGIRYQTTDKISYEVCIAAGCEFPSYAYLSGETNVMTCYTVSEDTRFAWVDDHYVLEDASFVQPSFSLNKVVDMSYSFSLDSSNGAVNFSLNSSDWPTSETLANENIVSKLACYSLLTHVIVTDVNDNILNVSADKVIINAWGAGQDSPAIGLGLPFSVTQIKKVEVLKGALFPTYSNYCNNDNSWYEINSTQSFYSSKDGLFYCGDNLTAKSYAEEFNAAFDDVCADYDGVTNNKEALEKKFYAFTNIYNEKLSSDIKSELLHSTDAEVIKMLATYDYVVTKYQLDDFLNRINGSSGSNLSLNSNYTTNIIVSIFSILAMSTIISMFIYMNKKKKGVR